jgi:hypothetical protein
MRLRMGRVEPSPPLLLLQNHHLSLLSCVLSARRAANLNHGYWTVPYFDCNGKVKKWLITYASPFFGWDSLKDKLEFK